MSNQGKSESSDYHSSSEVRYVPMDIEAAQSDEEKVDVTEILVMFWERKAFIFKCIGIFFIVGFLIAYVSPDEYSTTVKIIPENQAEFSLGSLGGLARQFGFSTRSNQSRESITPDLYPSVITSNLFLEELMHYEVPLPDSQESVPLAEYVFAYQRPPLFNTILGYTIYLPIRVKNWIVSGKPKGEPEISEADKKFEDPEKMARLTNLTNQEWASINMIRQRIVTGSDQDTGLFSVTVQMQDPLIAAMVADEIVQKLSDFIIENRTKKARTNYEFIEERFEEAKENFEAAQQELATFNDENRGQLTAISRTKEQLLQSQYELNFNLYNSMAERLEEARIQLQAETPVINVMEPASVPIVKSEPKTFLLITAFFFVGAVIGLGIIILQPFWTQLKFTLDKNNN